MNNETQINADRNADKRRLNILILVSCFLLLLTSCTKKTVLKLMVWGTQEEVKTARYYLKTFYKYNPEIKVEIISTNPFEFHGKLLELENKNGYPDVFYISREWFEFFVSTGILCDLTDFIKQDKEFGFDDFYDNVKKSFAISGRYYAIPKDFTPLILYYNQNIFDDCKVKYPTENWNWAEFLETAKKTTSNDHYGFVFEFWLGQYAPWLWNASGDFFDRKGNWNLYSKENIKALDFLQDMVYKYKTSPSPKVLQKKSATQLFIEGRAATFSSGRWSCLDFKNIKSFKWNVCSLPKYKNKTTVLLAVGYGINQKSKHKEDAWKLVRFLTGAGGEILVAQQGQAIPARRSIAQSPYFINSLPGIDNYVFLKAIENGKFTPTSANWPEIIKIMDKHLNSIFTEQIPPQKALSTLHSELEKHEKN
ncbi:MAG: sugar ABC transporter substrate-binding protein [Elusimicrobiota bacterium]